MPSVAPATTTEAGVFTAPLLPLISMTTPPVGAASPRVTVHVEPFPPTIVDGRKDNDVNAGGLIVTDADLTTEPRVAAIVANV